MQYVKRVLSVCLALVLLVALAPVGFADSEPLATVQFLTDATLDCEFVTFTNDSFGTMEKNGTVTPISPFGEALAMPIRPSRYINDRICACHNGTYYALFSLYGTQLTDYCYSDIQEIEGYICMKRGEDSADFFNMDGKKMPVPTLPEGYKFGYFLTDEVIAAEWLGSTTDLTWKKYGLFSIDGRQLSQSSYVDLSRLTDRLFVTRLSPYSNSWYVLNDRGELLTPNAVDAVAAGFGDGDFIAITNKKLTSEMDANESTYTYCDADGHPVWSCKGQYMRTFFNRYFAAINPEAKTAVLMDENGAVELPEWAMELGDEHFSVGHGDTSPAYLPLGAPETPLFFVRTINDYYTIYNSDCQVVIPASRCEYLTIAAQHVLVIKPEGTNILYNEKGEVMATLPAGQYELLANGMLVGTQGGSSDRYAVFNLQGEQVTDYLYDTYYEGNAYGLINVKRDGKWYLINVAGEEQNKVGFDRPVRFGSSDMYDIMSHFGGYRIGGKYGIIRYVEPGEGPFADVHTNDWFYSAVDYCYENGLMTGVGVGRFRPEGVTTRAMVATVLYRIAGQPETDGEPPFSDVKEGAWYADATIWAFSEGIINGYPDGTFRPDAPITREQFAALLYRYTKAEPVDVSLDRFPDRAKVSAYAYDAMGWAVGEGLINGVASDGVSYLKPQNGTTRAQLATILMRFLESMHEEA